MSSQFTYPPTSPYPPPKPSSSSPVAMIVLIVALAMLVPMLVCGVGILVALLLPAVQAARDAARTVQSSNNLKQIGMALHNYHDIYKTFPPAFLPDESGQPRTSWRTAILPFLEQGALHNQYDASALWNDPRNAEVVNRPLEVYHSPRDPSGLFNHTSYVVVRGGGTLFPGAQPQSMANMTRGASNTILIVEIRNSDIAWAEPRDLDIDSLTTDPRAPNSINLNAGAVVLLGDGSVRRLPRTVSLEEFKALLMSQGTATMP
jgi:type II secretory pathway pseudopilin PulG